MVKSRKFRKLRRPASSPLPIGDRIYALLERMGGSRERSGLVRLWENWTAVVGEDLASLGAPKGYKNRTLFLEGQDALDIQELHLRSEELLECVNNFLQARYFEKVKISLPGYR